MLGGVIGLIIGGRLLGLAQLWILATTLFALVCGCILWVQRTHIAISAQRNLPEHLHVGSDGRVDLTVVNQGGARTPTTQFIDHFANGDRSARFFLAPLDAGDHARAAYRVPTQRRGRYELGPLEGIIADPFGIANRRWEAASSQEVIIHPRVFEVNALPELAGGGIDTESRDVAGRPDTGGEFRTLRDYEESDDLRRVHWKTTARRGRLIVRENESRRRAPVVIMLDIRTTAHNPESFERAIEAAASIANALARAQRPFEFATTAGRRLGQPGRRFMGSLLDELAVLEPGANRIVQPTRRQRAAVLVAVMGEVREADATALQLAASGSALVLVATRAGAVPSPTSSRSARQRYFVVEYVDTANAFAPIWNQAVLTWHARARTRSLV